MTTSLYMVNLNSLLFSNVAVPWDSVTRGSSAQNTKFSPGPHCGDLSSACFGLSVVQESTRSSQLPPVDLTTTSYRLPTTSTACWASRSIASLFPSNRCFIMAHQASSCPSRNQQSTSERTRSRMPSLFNTIRAILYGTWVGYHWPLST